jgi:hypothetical protein
MHRWKDLQLNLPINAADSTKNSRDQNTAKAFRLVVMSAMFILLSVIVDACDMYVCVSSRTMALLLQKYPESGWRTFRIQNVRRGGWVTNI